jgi:hypothetical protein
MGPPPPSGQGFGFHGNPAGLNMTVGSNELQYIIPAGSNTTGSNTTVGAHGTSIPTAKPRSGARDLGPESPSSGNGVADSPGN